MVTAPVMRTWKEIKVRKTDLLVENARNTTLFFFFIVSCLRTGMILFVALMKTSEKSLLCF